MWEVSAVQGWPALPGKRVEKNSIATGDLFSAAASHPHGILPPPVEAMVTDAYLQELTSNGRKVQHTHTHTHLWARMILDVYMNFCIDVANHSTCCFS